MASILVIDDSPEIRKLIRNTLERNGHKVKEAVNGNEAISVLEDSAPDLLILDILMPEKDGLETIRDLKKSNKDVKILAISGGGQIGADGYLGVAKKMGVHKTLSKPFTLQELTDAVESLL